MIKYIYGNLQSKIPNLTREVISINNTNLKSNNCILEENKPNDAADLFNCADFENRNKRILDLSDKILDKIDCALNEVSKCVTKSKERIKNIEYDDDMKKPLSESYHEIEKADIIDGMIDTGSLKQIVSTLKDVRDIQAGYMKNSDTNDDSDETGIIFISNISENGCDSQ